MAEQTSAFNDRIVRPKDLKLVTGLSKSTIRRLELAGEFPVKLRISPGATGYLLSEILEWIESRRQPGIEGNP